MDNLSNKNDIVLDIKDLAVRYVLDSEVVQAVNGINIQLKGGEVLGLVGETGAGKTTTALSILNLLPQPTGKIFSGEINVCGRNTLQMPKHELEKMRGGDVSMIFQDPMTSLNPVFTVGEQIAESVRLHEHCTEAQANEKAEEILEMVGISKMRAHEYPHQFSGGMKQRVVIAIALACNPRLLLADEPTTALDVTIQAQILDMMMKLKDKLNTSIVFITHDLGIVAEICDKVAVMYAGKIVESGTLEEVFNHTRHPYTEGLFNSLPNINDRKAKLIPIPGLMPDPTKLPKGCAFAPRCRYATPECLETVQTERRITETHSIVCSAYDDSTFHIDRKDR